MSYFSSRLWAPPRVGSYGRGSGGCRSTHRPDDRSRPRSRALLADCPPARLHRRQPHRRRRHLLRRGRLDDAVRRQLESILVDPLLQTWLVGRSRQPSARSRPLCCPASPTASRPRSRSPPSTMRAARSSRPPPHALRHPGRRRRTTSPPRAPVASPPGCCRTRSSSASPIGAIEPVFVHASSPAPARTDRAARPRRRQLAELNRDRGMALDPAELRVIAD